MYLSVTVVTKSSSDAKDFQISNWAAALLRLQVSWFTYFSLVIHKQPLLLVCSEKKDKQHIVSTHNDSRLINTQEDHKMIMISGN